MKERTRLIRIFLILTMIASLMAIDETPAGAQGFVELDAAHYEAGQIITINAMTFALALPGQVTIKSFTPAGGAWDTEIVAVMDNAGVSTGTLATMAAPPGIVPVPGDGNLHVFARGTVSVTVGLTTATADIVELSFTNALFSGIGKFYKIGNSVNIQLVAPSATSAVDTISLTVTGIKSGAAITGYLTENGATSGVYTGAITLIEMGATAGVGQLKVLEPLDQITVTYGKAIDLANVDSGAPASTPTFVPAGSLFSLTPILITVTGTEGAFSGYINGTVTGNFAGSSTAGGLTFTAINADMVIGTTITPIYADFTLAPALNNVVGGVLTDNTVIQANRIALGGFGTISDVKGVFTALPSQITGFINDGVVTNVNVGAGTGTGSITARLDSTVGPGMGTVSSANIKATISATVNNATGVVTGVMAGTISGFLNPNTTAIPLAGVNKLELSLDGGTTFQIVAFGGSHHTLTSAAFFWSPTSDGVYTVVTRASDPVGNVEAIPAAAAAGTNKVSVTVDTTKPALTDLTLLRADTNTTDTTVPLKVFPGRSINITVNVNDDLSGIQTGSVAATIGGVPVGTLTGVANKFNATTGNGLYALNNVPASNLPGTYTMSIAANSKATDALGANVGATPVTAQFVVLDDTVAPVMSGQKVLYTTGTQALNDGTDNVRIIAKATDDISGIFDVTVDAQPLTGAEGSIAMTMDTGETSPTKSFWVSAPINVAATTTVGPHTLTITAQDNAPHGDPLERNASTANIDVEVVVVRTNSPPTAPVVDVAPNSPLTTDDLVATIVSPGTDPDGDPVTYSYAWYKGGVLLPAFTTNTAPASATTKGDVWKVVVTPSDGTVNGPAGEDQVTVGNSPPTLPVVNVAPNPPLTTDDLAATIVTPGTDPDGDPVTYSYSWYKDNVLQPQLTSDTVPSSNTSVGEVWKVVVTPNDGTVEGHRDRTRSQWQGKSSGIRYTPDGT